MTIMHMDPISRRDQSGVRAIGFNPYGNLFKCLWG